MKKRILVIGSKGMAGHVILETLKTHCEFIVEDISRSSSHFESTYTLDVTNFNELEGILKNGSFDFVINCVGILNQYAEERPDMAVLINSYLPQFLSYFSGALSYKLIHISTDCVFSGAKGGYKEDDFKDGHGFYAQSKALGEVSNSRDLTVRTSIIGPELKNGIGLFHWFMSQSGKVQGYTQAWWSGVTTIELAKFIVFVLMDTQLVGLVHLTNGRRISKYELLRLFNQTFRDNALEILPHEGKSVDKSLINTKDELTYQVPFYEDMVTEMSDWMKSKKERYGDY